MHTPFISDQHRPQTVAGDDPCVKESTSMRETIEIEHVWIFYSVHPRYLD